MTRKQIATELMAACPANAWTDHRAIAAAIRRGEPKSAILEMTETNNWPDTYVWLKTMLD